jgi:hypothetical protein
MMPMSGRTAWLTRAIVVVVLAWSVVAAVSAFRAMRTRPPDPWAIVTLQREFLAFVPDLPPSGRISYLEPATDPDSPANVRTFYAAQYALAPRVIERGLDHEFLIVAERAERAGGDPRLMGFVLAASAPGGHRLYRRFP